MSIPEKLLICGSGASEAIPALFCTCGLCQEAWRRGGKDFRSRTAYQLGEEIRIDFGPDILLHRERYHLHYEKMKHLFISHPHRDHFTPIQLNYHVHKEMGPALLADHTLTLHGTREVIAQFQDNLTPDFTQMRMLLDELEPESGSRTLENGIRFSYLWANHFCEGALNFIIEFPDGFTFFIGTDSGRFLEKTWAVLSRYRFDLMILDGTAGVLDIDGGHMTAKQVVDTVGRLRKEKIITDSTRLITNHFAHCAGMLHTDLEKFYTPYGIEPAYDGMEIPLVRGK